MTRITCSDIDSGREYAYLPMWLGALDPHSGGMNTNYLLDVARQRHRELVDAAERRRLQRALQRRSLSALITGSR